MKQLLSLLLIYSILSSCERKNSNKTQSEFKPKTELTAEIESGQEKKMEAVQSKSKQDTINSYWALVLDTISSQREFKITNLKYTLELKTYSLNDSSIVRNLARDGELAYLEHSHKMVSDLKLLTDSIIDKKQIDRTDFIDSLFPKICAECNLFLTQIDSIIESTIYLTSDLNVPDTGNQWRVWYSIQIKDKKIGNLKIQEFNYVGD